MSGRARAPWWVTDPPPYSRGIGKAIDTAENLYAVALAVKEWRDSDTNDPFPHDVRKALEAAIAKAEGRQ